jgi:OOP family OmpA-OmpF porin
MMKQVLLILMVAVSLVATAQTKNYVTSMDKLNDTDEVYEFIVAFTSSHLTLNEIGKEALRPVIAYIIQHPNVNIKFELGMHTNPLGSSRFNMVMSTNRAQVAVDYMIEQGVNPKQLVPVGYGESQPKYDIKDKEEMLKNQRTELKVLSIQ